MALIVFLQMEEHKIPILAETNETSNDTARNQNRLPHESPPVEGSGGIVCPIRWDKEHKILLEDIVKALNLNTLVIADAGLGTINAVVLTIEYIRNHGMGVKGVILNHYVGGIMQEDNARMIEELTGIPVIAKVKDGDGELAIDIEKLKKIYN